MSLQVLMIKENFQLKILVYMKKTFACRRVEPVIWWKQRSNYAYDPATYIPLMILQKPRANFIKLLQA